MALFHLNLTDSLLEDDFKKVGESIPFSGLLRWVIIAIGLPLNFLVAWVILQNHRLHNSRNAFWLGNIVCHLVTLLMGALEAILFMNPQREQPNVFCNIYALLVGSPYTNLLVSLLLATADRWIAISYPLRHRSHVTVFRVAVFLVSSWVLVLAAMTSPYWSGKFRLLSCSVHPEIMKWLTFSNFVLVVIIIIAQVKVYTRTREYFRFGAHRPPVTAPSSSDRQQQPVDAVVGEAVGSYFGSSSGSSRNRLKSDEYFVHLPDKTISRLELEASVTLLCGVASLCLFTLPLVSLYVAIFVGRMIGQSWVGQIVALVPYARELLLLHPVVSMLLYVFRSREFSCALRRMIPCCFVKRQRQQDIPLRQFWILRAQCQISRVADLASWFWVDFPTSSVSNETFHTLLRVFNKLPQKTVFK